MRRLLLVAAAAGGALAAAAAGARWGLAHQAAAARAVIGKPLGEEALAADRTWRKKHGDRIELLLLGDSIAAGLGATKPKHTLGAQLARRLGRRTERAVRLHTAAVVGSESSALLAQLAGLPASYRPDVAVLVVGGNDVTHRVPVADSVRYLGEAVEALQESGCVVVVGTCPDLSALAALPQPLRSLAGTSSRRLATAQQREALRLGARAVSLSDVVGPFFLSQPDSMFAVDRFHPSSEGYKRTAKAILPSVLAALGYAEDVPFGHHAPRAG
ncbi:hypothetical protein GCM10011519_00420 [Marmoricola endophyticus]|uniref:SGNH hydrolase-type esterase domain-containing protein n=1 Tax=Marmoricola endophyticus TaxID=2040280 RepID=A0A917EZZ1_9ACTN|nr:SGNH/GDSL hydrolase family protein [Marmoricola endophyticus]GGF30917.1 hypothetical protein GCM10011519_00420 [Marmoricola endophyticus]